MNQSKFKRGIIDLGTNSMRLLIAEIENGKVISRRKYINTTRLGKGIDKDGNINSDAIELNIKSLKDFKKKCEEENCITIDVIATEALRKAKNKEKFIEEAYEKTGLTVKVIDGEREAFLGYKGVTSGIDLKDTVFLVVDIGGGSTEFVLGDKEKVYFRESVPIGALVLTDRYISVMPEKDEEIIALKKEIEMKLNKTIDEIKTYDRGNRLKLIGIGGTITSVSAINQKLTVYSMDRVHLSTITFNELREQIETIRKMTIYERRNIAGLQKKRAEIILTGELILEKIMQKMNIEKVTVSEYDNLEGLLFEKYMDL